MWKKEMVNFHVLIACISVIGNVIFQWLQHITLYISAFSIDILYFDRYMCLSIYIIIVNYKGFALSDKKKISLYWDELCTGKVLST